MRQTSELFPAGGQEAASPLRDRLRRRHTQRTARSRRWAEGANASSGRGCLLQRAARRRSDLIPAIMRRSHTDFVHEVMNEVFHVRHLVDDSELTDLAAMSSLPALNILLDMMEEIVHRAERSRQALPVLLMLLRVSPLSGLENLIRLPVGFGEARVVLVVVVQIQTELVSHVFQARRQVIDMGKAAELDRNRLRRDGVLSGHDRGRIVVVGVLIRVVRPLEPWLRRNHVAVAVVVGDDPMAMRIHEDVVMMPRRHVTVIVVMMVVLRQHGGATAQQRDRQKNAASGMHYHRLHTAMFSGKHEHRARRTVFDSLAQGRRRSIPRDLRVTSSLSGDGDAGDGTWKSPLPNRMSSRRNRGHGTRRHTTGRWSTTA